MSKFVLLFASCLVIANAHIVKRQARPCPDECENKPMDISFIVDASSSIWPQNFTRGLWFVQDFIDLFDIGPDQVRVSMVTYGDKVYDQDAFGFDIHTDKDALNKAITTMPYHAGTATETGLAIKWFLENHKPHAREGVRSVLIVLTDGNSQKPDVTKEEASKALDMGLEVFAIGVGISVSSQELHNIATDGEHVFVVTDYEALDHIKTRLAYEACGVKPNPPCSFSPVDLSFVIDSSRSIGAGNFSHELFFIKDFIEVFKINPSSARVAAIMFGDRVYDEHVIEFDAFNGKKNTLDAILALNYMEGGSTETGKGIEYMVDNFVPKFRADAAHIGIVITDGKSQNWKFTEEAAQMARDKGITTVAVGVGKIGSELDKKELGKIAGDPERVITVDDFPQLNAIREKLIDITCHGISAELKARHDNV